ncbi:MAG: CBS domain-containing protein [Bdellovibrionales bacterium]|nr:CBS domain-containing protein [Bdellovibrionales bacterium]
MDEILDDYKVTQLPLNKGLVVAHGTKIHSVLQFMREQKTGCILIKKGDKYTGIFTEHDFVRLLFEKHSWDKSIEDVATPNPWVIQSDMHLKDAIVLMKEKNIRHIPVFEKTESLVGVLSVRSVIKLIAEHFPADVMNLPPRLHKDPKTPEGG